MTDDRVFDELRLMFCEPFGNSEEYYLSPAEQRIIAQALDSLGCSAARVTGERDALVRALEDCVCMLENLSSDAGDPDGGIRVQIAEARAAIEACKP